MPGARSVMIVVMKLTAPMMVQGEAEHPEVAADARAERRARERRVRRPSERGRALRREEPGDRDERAEEVEPVGQCVQARERDIRGTDLEGHRDVGEAREQRRREHQQHDRAVHREQLVVRLVGRHDVEARREQLHADDECEHATDQEVDERGDQVEVPDRLVVSGGDPLDEDVALALDRRLPEGAGRCRRLGRRGRGRGAHSPWSSFVVLPSVPGRLLFVLYSGPRRPSLPASRKLSMYAS
jgi:hypothetical protein